MDSEKCRVAESVPKSELQITVLEQTEEEIMAKKLYCKIVYGDSRKVLPKLDELCNLIVTSPPYADARKKHYDGTHPDDFAKWFMTFHEPFYNALAENGNFILNIKDRVVKGVRHRFVWQTIMGLEKAGWLCIDDYIWQKTNPMPGYWPNRLRDGWEYCFHMAKIKRPFINQDAIKRPIGEWADVRLKDLNGKSAVRHNSENDSGFGRDLRKWVGKEKVLPSNVLPIACNDDPNTIRLDLMDSDSSTSNVVSLPLVGFNRGHPAVFPVGLPEFFIKLMTPKDGLILDPFGGSGTTAIAALNLGRSCIIIDNNLEYCEIAASLIAKDVKKKNYEIIKEGF